LAYYRPRSIALRRLPGLISWAGIVLALQGLPLAAQNFGSTGQSWTGSWGFASPADRTLLMQQAQAIRAANQAPAGPSTVVYNTTTNDNRENYQDIQAGAGTLGNIDFHLNGDRIGQNTNTVGAMNTGTTNVEINGSSNVVNATNAADSQGCLDGSISMSETGLAGFATPQTLSFSLAEAVSSLDCAVQ